MSPSPIERIQTVRPLAAEAAALATGRVVPVVPVNPTQAQAVVAEPLPGVINLVNPVNAVTTDNKSSVGEGVYSSVSDPTRPGADAASAPKDWTIKRPAPEKVEDPPPEPMSKILLDHIKSLWEASASAVQVQQQVRNLIEPITSTSSVTAPGVIANEVYNFSPTKINKIEKTQN